MIDLDIKPSPRLIRLIAQVERFCGAWQRISMGGSDTRHELAEKTLIIGASAGCALDSSTPLRMLLEQQRDEQQSPWLRPDTLPPELRGFVKLHEKEFPLSGEQLLGIFTEFLLGGNIRTTVGFRSEVSPFRAPATDDSLGRDELVFQTVPAFLIPKKNEELLEWLSEELSSPTHHPLIIIGTFHLLFLQISPFHTGNHRAALYLLWRLLVENGYEFVQCAHFAPFFYARSKQYFHALRQAERTLHGNWSTLNVWLEFFLETLCAACESLEADARSSFEPIALTSVQRKILEVVERRGCVSREQIVLDTGINVSTVKYNLSQLARRGRLLRDGAGRTTSYRVS